MHSFTRYCIVIVSDVVLEANVLVSSYLEDNK